MKIGIIGTAGRILDAKRLTAAHFTAMCEHTEKLLQEHGLGVPDRHFVSGWLHRLYVSLPTRKDYEGAIFIDDPELGLDARTDSMLGPALEQLLPHAQFIYATKSPGLWDHAYSFERVMLLQPGDSRGRREYPNGNE